MRDIIKHLYDGLLNFLPLRRHVHLKSNHKGIFPVVGFLDDSRKKLLETAIGIEIESVEYFEQALTHRSYLQILGPDSGFLSNERLEFLGDSVLGLIISDYLFSLHQTILEGELTKMRSWLVNKNSLAYCAKKMGLDKFLMLSFSAEKALKNGSDSILADALEAVIAAVYLDSGLDSARDFVYQTVVPLMLDKSIMADTNFKSALLEKVQSLGFSSPKYVVLEEKGPDHDKEFIVGVYVDNDLAGTGSGKNKKQAEQIAAQLALDKNIFSNKIEPNHGKINI